MVDRQEQRIAILRALHLGDLMCSVPALRTIRAGLPSAEITLVGLPWSGIFIERFHAYIDRLIEFPGYPGLPERTPLIDGIPGFLSKMQSEHFSLAIQMQGSGSIVNSLVPLFGANRSAGFYIPGEYCPDPDTYISYPGQEPEVIRHLRLVENLGFPGTGSHLEFPMDEADWEETRHLLEENTLLPGSYICVHVGSRSSSRRWPTDRFAQVADRLAGDGYQVVLTGSSDEIDLTGDVSRQMKSPSINLAGKTRIGSLAGLISQSRLLICNDTGVSHLADALRVPSVVIFTGSDPARWAPLDRSLHRVIESGNRVNPSVVVDEARDLFQKIPSYAT